MTNRLISQALPLARMMAGAFAGYLCLQVDHIPMDAVVLAAALPVFIGLFTEEMER